MRNENQEYKIRLPLASGADLEILLHNHEEHRWIFSHRYASPQDDPSLVNDTRLVVSYQSGIPLECHLSMHVRFVPLSRRGKVRTSLDGTTTLVADFEYEKQHEKLQTYYV